ncbi:aldehyde dehydrogenase [Streptomyces mexicanus]|jgi:acyl-CoA reductase-like NAD-dependent aldehyde dehydrogenase|uniref:Aldehyde dehydrogenase n=1 Tax=Streptomyces mexicanus TaxID=178566 RepID=A0A7X1LPW9_9ACTN|nr:aldehyde dehydrogenase [Streptomyces mexicanus]MBC2864999.1 aldehyde dehydrogenase [Streptomyces mexicanus]
MTTASRADALHDKILVGGEWVSSSGNDWIEVENPATEEILGVIPHATTDDADRAIAAAARAFDEGPWPRLTPAERADMLAKVADGIRARSQEFAELYTRDQGGVAAFAPYMSRHALTIVGDFVDRGRTLSLETEDRNTPAGRALVYREPVGPVAAIVPWNAPLILTMVKVAPALIAGCPVVVKVSPESPLVSFPLAEIFESAGFPPGVVSFLPGGRELGRHIVAHPAIRHVSFTGSTASGQAVMRSAADNLTRLTLELGGKSAAIVLDDMEPDDFLPQVLPSCLGQSGQVCTTQSRILVPKAKHARFRDALADYFGSLPVGDPSDPKTLIGPLVSREQRERAERYVQVAKDDGGLIVTGGRRPPHLDRGYFYEPTLVDGVTNDMRIAREEVFGPVISLLTYDGDDEAVRIANDTDFGLGNGVHTKDVDRGIALARRLQSGTVSINDSGCIMTEPWGGMKKSGLGREGGLEGIDAYLEYRQIQLTPFPAS